MQLHCKCNCDSVCKTKNQLKIKTRQASNNFKPFLWQDLPFFFISARASALLSGNIEIVDGI